MRIFCVRLEKDDRNAGKERRSDGGESDSHLNFASHVAREREDSSFAHEKAVMCRGGKHFLDPYQTLPTPQDPRAGMQYATRAHPGKIVSGVTSSIRYGSRAIGVPGSVVLTLIGALHRAR